MVRSVRDADRGQDGGGALNRLAALALCLALCAPARGQTPAPAPVGATALQRITDLESRVARLEAEILGPPAPEPTPAPTPTPTPAPTPPPAPVPAGYAGPLWAVFVQPANPTPAQRALIESPGVRALKAKPLTVVRAYLETQPEAAPWKAAVAQAGGAPVVLWVGWDQAKKGVLLKVTKPPTEAGVVADYQSVRAGR